MGVDLVQIASHNIVFEGRTFKEIATEITERLNSIILVNTDFLKQFALDWCCDNSECIKEIKNTHNWSYYNDEEWKNLKDDYIEFKGPYDLELQFTRHNIVFYNPPYRYRVWMLMTDNNENPDVEIRNEWRKYMFQILSLFGGSKVLYLPDNCYDLSVHYNQEIPLNTIINDIELQFGKPSASMEEAYNSDGYFIDDLNNIDWELSVKPLEYKSIIEQFLKQMENSFYVTNDFNNILKRLAYDNDEAKKQGYKLEESYEQLQFLFTFFRRHPLCVYVTKYNTNSLVISLRKENTGLTIFFKYTTKEYCIVSKKIAIDEGFLNEPHNCEINILVDADKTKNQQYIYNDAGEFLNLNGTDINVISGFESKKTFTIN